MQVILVISYFPTFNLQILLTAASLAENKYRETPSLALLIKKICVSEA